MADARFGDMTWEKENLQCYGGEGALFTQRSQGEGQKVGERVVCQVAITMLSQTAWYSSGGQKS